MISSWKILKLIRNIVYLSNVFVGFHVSLYSFMKRIELQAGWLSLQKIIDIIKFESITITVKMR